MNKIVRVILSPEAEEVYIKELKNYYSKLIKN